HMSPPRLIGNTGEQGEFVLPLSVPGKVEQKYDDFNYDAAAWTLTAHEARPGHELQFASMVERGVSLARAIFAFNSVNVEGWGLYAEAITLPYMPDDGKLVSLQLRLQRAARAFVDPELQMGKWTPDSARQFLMKEVGLSPAFATSEVDRYTFRSPAQATAAQTPVAVLTGVVVDANTQAPVSEAVVIARSPSLVGEQSAITDESGAFEITWLPAGMYSLAVRRDGFEPYAPEPLAIKGGKVRIRIAVAPVPMPMPT